MFFQCWTFKSGLWIFWPTILHFFAHRHNQLKMNKRKNFVKINSPQHFLLIKLISKFLNMIRGLSLIKWPSEMLQNLPCFMYKKTQSYSSHFVLHYALFFPPNEFPIVWVNYRVRANRPPADCKNFTISRWWFIEIFSIQSVKNTSTTWLAPQ